MIALIKSWLCSNWNKMLKLWIFWQSEALNEHGQKNHLFKIKLSRDLLTKLIFRKSKFRFWIWRNIGNATMIKGYNYYRCLSRVHPLIFEPPIRGQNPICELSPLTTGKGHFWPTCFLTPRLSAWPLHKIQNVTTVKFRFLALVFNSKFDHKLFSSLKIT